MTNVAEPRALSAALAAPAFVTRTTGAAMHAADRHVERWAPEANAGRVRSMRSLGFVDRLVAPWIETAQRSASMRLFHQYAQSGLGERSTSSVSWVFPRPWYQDELDWMAAARRTGAQTAVERQPAPTLLTTRGTYVAPVQAASAVAAPPLVMPAALYEHVAPSLSIAASQRAAIAGVGFGGDARSRGEVYSPLVPLAAVQAAELMTRMVAPLASARGAAAGAAMTPALRTVLTSILARAAVHAGAPATRISTLAPELVTPPSPRPEAQAAREAPAAGEPGALQVAESYAAQRTRVAELERIALSSAQRELAARAAATPVAPAAGAPASAEAGARVAAEAARAATQAAELRAAAERAEIELRQRTAAGQAETQRRADTARTEAQRQAEAARTEAQRQADAATAAVRAAEAQRQAEAGTAAVRAAEAQRQAEAGTAAVRAAEAQRQAEAGTAAVRAAEAQRQADAARTEAQRHADAATAAVRAAEAQRQADAATAAVRAAEAQRRAEAAGTAVRATEAQRQADAASAAGAERAQIEARIAQRIAERTSAQRLHEQARAEAAAHARAGELRPIAGLPAPASSTVSPAEGGPASARLPDDVAAAIAGLPPELAGLLHTAVDQRPERAMQAIHDLNEALRTVELLARSSATGAAFEATRGPRLVMPAGLGGLVSAVDRAHSLTAIAASGVDEASAIPGGRRAAPLLQLVAPRTDEPGGAAPGMPAREVRVPALTWLSAEPRSQAIAPSSALGATTSSAPAALSHVAWADRWLARFAGAGSQSLDLISATGAATPAARLQALAQAAPGVVFVAPDFLRGDLAAGAAHSAMPSGAMPSAAMPSAAMPSAAMPSAPPLSVVAPGGPALGAPSELRRFDDNAETPDDVFAAIAAAASRGRATAARTAAPQPTPAPATTTTAAAATAVDRPMFADLVAHSAPSAPGAGLAAQLASSPFAPALRHVLALPAATSFDVRSLFGASLGATYLAGLVGSVSHELRIGAQSAPIWATWSEAPLALAADRPELEQIGRPDRIDRIVPGFDAAYVSPDVPAARHAEDLAGLPAAAASDAIARDTGAPLAASLAALRDSVATLTTLRTQLLSWDTAAAPGALPGSQLAPASAASAAFAASAASATSATPAASAAYREAIASAGAARRMIEAMSLPMLGESTPALPAWAAPGMVAERAQSWSVAQERSVSDLALDFVAPELVLAARVYGLGPAEAAQASRLAIAGSGQLGAMASTVDRTFVEAMAIGREARLEATRHRIAAERAAVAGDVGRAPGVPTAPAVPGVPGVSPFPGAAEPAARAAITTAFPTADGGVAAAIAPIGAAAPTSGAAFGVERRAPRGAFLWPAATVAALGMTASGSDGQLSMPVAALELLAAQVVAELGTFTALAEARNASLGLTGLADAERSTSAPGAMGVSGATGVSGAMGVSGATGVSVPDATGAAGEPAVASRVSSLTMAAARAAQRDAGQPGIEPAEAEVLGAAAAFVPASRRARFEQLYVALSQSPTAAQWSPAARAARALALAGRGEDAGVTARERAATAWDVLPVVYAGLDAAAAQAEAGAAASAAPSGAEAARAAIAQSMSHVAPSWLGSPGARPAARGAASRSARSAAGPRDVVAADFGDGGADSIYVGSPGLGGLSARAGEALGSYVTPAAPPSAPRERSADTTSVGAVLRAPTAAPEYVQTGRTGGRHGGGEVEIPPWFEAAARKMLAERSDSAGISLAELTLVTAAPATQIAASTRSAPSASPPTPSTAAAANQSDAPQIDVEKLANEVYRNILVLMDVARARNGDPFL